MMPGRSGVGNAPAHGGPASPTLTLPHPTDITTSRHPRVRVRPFRPPAAARPPPDRSLEPTLPHARTRSPRWSPLVVALLALLPFAPDASAQAARFALEFRGGGTLPTAPFADGARPGEGAAAGPSFGLSFGVTARPGRTTMVGFSQHRFACEDAGCDPDGTWVATNVEIGFRYNLRVDPNLMPWIRVGGLTTRVELDAHPDYRDALSDLGYGGEIGAGLLLAPNRTLAFSPGVRFTAVNTGLPGGGLLRMRYVVADLGLVVAF